MKTTVIKTVSQYRDYKKMADELLALDPAPDSPEGEKLELYAVLIEEYEAKKYKFAFPNPIDAIIFRMEEEGLKQKDLIPYIGSKSKVSEILSGNRSLTINMIRALNKHLGIPLKVLISTPEKDLDDVDEYEWKSYSMTRHP